MIAKIGKLVAAFSRLHWLLQWLILSLVSLLIYFPIIGNYFVNDDFIVLDKVCLQKKLNTDGFFRPLSDISIYINYFFSGLNPVPYRITSVVLHALNAPLLFRFLSRFAWTQDDLLKQAAAGLATVFFLTYPFHNEPVVWLLGRASLLASTFAFLGLAVLAGKWRDSLKLPAVAICYFLGMMGYETVMVLPAIVAIWLLLTKAPLKKIAVWMIVLSGMLAAHFLIRIYVSGSVTGEYGGRLMQWDIIELAGRALKVIARLFIPPVYDQGAGQIIAMVLIAAGIMCIAIWFWKQTRNQKDTRRWAAAIAAMLFFALLTPFMIGVSTRTSESDRLLYFPSFFLCALAGIVFTTVLQRQRRAVTVLLLLSVLAYQLVWLQINNLHWRISSNAVTTLFSYIKEKKRNNMLYIVNMPAEFKGAYIFRVGFKEALRVHNIDHKGIILFSKDMFNNYLDISVNTSDRVIYWKDSRWVEMDPQALFK